jgi:hypothetical protein
MDLRDDATALQGGATHSDALVASISSAVERQLNRYAQVMSQQIEASTAAAEAVRADLQAELDRQVEQLNAVIQRNQRATEAYQKALQSALEERLTDFANHQYAQLSRLDAKIAALPEPVQEDLPQLVADTRADLERAISEHRTGLAADIERALTEHRSDVTAEIERVRGDIVRLDGLSVAALQHTNTSVEELAARWNAQSQQLVELIDQRHEALRIAAEDGDEAVTVAVNQRFESIRVALEQFGGQVHQQVSEITNRMTAADSRVAEITAKLDRIDEDALEDMRSQLSTAVGEAMLVRIELDRAIAGFDEKFDRNALRMAEIESLLADEMDVSAVVQLERLDELERAIIELNPDQFVRRTDAPPAPPTLRPPAS